MRLTTTSSPGARLLFDGWVSRCSWKTITVTLYSSFLPMGQKVSLGLAGSATLLAFTVDLTESCSIKRASGREQCSPGPKLLRLNRSRRYAASSPGSGMTSATTSSRLWHVDRFGRHTAVYRIYASLV